jgi:hypothetical protein
VGAKPQTFWLSGSFSSSAAPVIVSEQLSFNFNGLPGSFGKDARRPAIPGAGMRRGRRKDASLPTQECVTPLISRLMHAPPEDIARRSAIRPTNRRA